MPGFGAALMALALVGAAVSAVVVPARPARAGQTTFVVTKTADTNDGSCEQEDCSLREAIVAANAAAGSDVEVPAGTYKLTIGGRNEDDGATGDLDIRAGTTIRGDGARKTIVDGRGIDRVFHTPIVGLAPTPFTVGVFGLTITGGAIPDSVGGGIAHHARGATLNLSESTVRGNSALQGGGIQSGGGQGFEETVAIRRSTISGNRAPGGQGGGIQNTENLTLENVTVSGNASLFGGGIMQNGTARITNSTIAFNKAQQPGGGMTVSSPTTTPTTLKNTIVANNASDFEKNCSRPVNSEGNNLEKGATCGFVQAGDKKGDPKLGPLADNGGPTNTHALLQGSPAIGAGGTPFPATDQRGVARPQGAANDIGAVEKQRRARQAAAESSSPETAMEGRWGRPGRDERTKPEEAVPDGRQSVRFSDPLAHRDERLAPRGAADAGRGGPRPGGDRPARG